MYTSHCAVYIPVQGNYIVVLYPLLISIASPRSLLIYHSTLYTLHALISTIYTLYYLTLFHELLVVRNG
jgi:hypothetical protein